MKILFVTDLHGSKGKYDRLLDTAQQFRADVVINGGDMLPKDGELFSQGEFITDYLAEHFAQLNLAGIYYCVTSATMTCESLTMCSIGLAVSTLA